MYLVPGGVPGPMGYLAGGRGYLVPGAGVPGSGGVPGPGGVYLVPGGSLAWEMYLVWGVPGQGGCTWSQVGGVPGQGGVPAQVLSPSPPPWTDRHV